MDQNQGKVLERKILPDKIEIYQEVLHYQQELQKQYPNYILGIKDYNFLLKKNKLEITYNCSKDAKSLSQLEFNKFEEKIRMFDQLLEIAEFLEKNNITHNNIKKNNLIIDDNKLYLSDFGYIAGQPKLNMFRNELNFIYLLNQDQKKQIYPYLTTDLFNDLFNCDKNELRSKLQKRKPQEIMQYDQHVLTSLMVEIFSPLDLNSCELSNLKNFSFSQKIMYIKDNNPDFPKYAIFIIEQILQFRFQKENQLTPEFPKHLEPMLKKIDTSRLINANNQKLVQDYLDNKDFEFDLGLLYCFTKDQLMRTQSDILESDKEFDRKLKKKIYRILAIFEQINQYEFKMNDYKQLQIDDQLLCLVYLDQQIENFQISNSSESSKEIKQLLQNYTLKWQLIQFYDLINNESKEKFKVSQAYQKYYRGKLSIHPETHEYNEILQEYINHIKVEMQFDINEDQSIDKDTIIIRQRDKKDQKITYKLINKGEMVIHEVQANNILQYCKHLKVLKFNRHFQPKNIVTFKLIKEFEIHKPKVIDGNVTQTVELIDYKKKIKYNGEYYLDLENRDIIFAGEGTREILETGQTTLKIGDAYKVKGTFHNNILEGDQIITYYYHFDENNRTYSKGQYRQGNLSGKHVHYLVEQPNKIVKTIYHCSCCFCSPLLSCYSWCAWCPCFFNYYMQIN